MKTKARESTARDRSREPLGVMEYISLMPSVNGQDLGSQYSRQSSVHKFWQAGALKQSPKPIDCVIFLVDVKGKGKVTRDDSLNSPLFRRRSKFASYLGMPRKPVRYHVRVYRSLGLVSTSKGSVRNYCRWTQLSKSYLVVQIRYGTNINADMVVAARSWKLCPDLWS
jgi:hypothetical protein